MMDWFSTACCLYGARLKSEGRPWCYQVKAKGKRGTGGVGVRAAHCLCTLLNYRCYQVTGERGGSSQHPAVAPCARRPPAPPVALVAFVRAATEPPSKWTEAGARCCGGSPGPLLGPPAGAQQQGVASSALCECGSGAARGRALRGPCLCVVSRN
jgi:hypothetical protein